jgi:hypothetical protein
MFVARPRQSAFVTQLGLTAREYPKSRFCWNVESFEKLRVHLIAVGPGVYAHLETARPWGVCVLHKLHELPGRQRDPRTYPGAEPFLSARVERATDCFRQAACIHRENSD